MHEAAQIEIGVVGDVGRHLRVTEVSSRRAVTVGAQRPHKMRFPRSRLAVKQQHALLHVEAAARGNRRHEIVEFLPRLGVDLRHVDRIGPPQVVLPRDRMLERLAQLVGSQRRSKRGFFQ